MNEAINKLSQDDALTVLRAEIGYYKPMPDILTFLDDDYFLGGIYYDKIRHKSKVYDYWRWALTQVFPNDVTSNTYISVSGAIGTGKSTFTQIIFLYDYLKYSYIANPGSYLELLNLNGIKFKWFNLYKYKAFEQVNPINEIISKAPCFQDLAKEREQGGIGALEVGPAASTKDIISQDVPVFGLSEINFMGEKATEIINSCLSRLESRFQKGIDLLTHFILDSSDVSSSSPTELFIHNSAYSNRVLSFHVPIWKAKPHQYGKMGWFKVYAGDSAISPHILDENENTEGLDKDRIVKVPGELRPAFESDIQLALQEKVGIGLMTGGMLFPDDKIKANFNIPKTYHDVDVVDFFNAEQIADLDGMKEAIEMLPNDRALFIGCDAGISNDKYGIAIGYADNLTYKRMPDGKQVPDIFIKVPIAFSLSRKKGQETSITKVRDFIMEIASRKIVKKVVLDTFASSQLKQELTLNKIDCGYLSVDKSDQPYLLLKRLMYENRVNIADNKLLYREFKCLAKTGDNKIDHTNSGGEGLRFGEIEGAANSKDIADAVCRVVQEIYNLGAESFYAPKEDVAQQQNYMGELYSGMLRARKIKSEILRSKMYR